MKNRYVDYVRGWRDAVASVSGEGCAFNADAGLPLDEPSAQQCLAELLVLRGLCERGESLRIAEDMAACPHVVWGNGMSARLPLLSYQLYCTNDAVWARILKSGIDRELRAAFQATAGRGSGHAQRSIFAWRKRFSHERREPEPFYVRLQRKGLTPEVFKYERAVGVEIECFGLVPRTALREALPLWSAVVNDGSIAPQGEGEAHEIRLLLTRSELEPRLWRVCKILERLGLRVNRSCGLHVHLDQRGQSEQQVEKRARMMNAWLSALQELVPASRRNNDFCRFGVSWNRRYHAVNLCAFTSHKTLEIRLHSGTTDYSKIIAWIRLLELLGAMVKKPRAGGCLAVLEQLPLAAHDLAYWRTRHQQLNPAMYGSNIQQETE